MKIKNAIICKAIKKVTFINLLVVWSTSLFAQTFIEYEPSYALWNLGIQIGVVEQGAYVNAPTVSLAERLNDAIAMADASGCISVEGIVTLRDKMQTATYSSSLYNEIYNYRIALGNEVTANCICEPRGGGPSWTTEEFFPDIGGQWFRSGNIEESCAISQNGKDLLFQMKNKSSPGFFSSQTALFASEWNSGGVLSEDYQTITWSDQVWSRNAKTPVPSSTSGKVEGLFNIEHLHQGCSMSKCPVLNQVIPFTIQFTIKPDGSVEGLATDSNKVRYIGSLDGQTMTFKYYTGNTYLGYGTFHFEPGFTQIKNTSFWVDEANGHKGTIWGRK